MYVTELWDSAASSRRYPRIPVTRKWRLPWILVQLMKLSMLLESTVCLCSAPVPSHTAAMTESYFSLCRLIDKLRVWRGDIGWVLTFGAEPAAELTLPLAFTLHLHLVWGTNADAGAPVHHEMSCREKEKNKNKKRKNWKSLMSAPRTDCQ